MTKIKTWLTIGVASLPLLALAQSIPRDRPVEAIGVRSFEDILGIVTKAIGWFQTIIFIIATIMILYAAFLYVTVGKGGDDNIKKAKDIILYAAIGIGVALLAFAVEPIVQNFLGGVRPR